MKIAYMIRNPGVVAVTALLAAIGLAPSANAQLTMSYEATGGGHTIGDPFSGAYKINFGDFDMGSTYTSFPVGTAKGFGQAGTGTQTIPGGIATLDAAQSAGATGARSVNTTVNGVDQGAGTVGPEDSWGIAKVSQITDLANNVVWSSAGKKAEITVMFYGEKDFYITQLANGFQEINGVGLHTDLYLQNYGSGFTAFDPTLGSAGRTGVSSYTNVTDGTLILSTVSTSGFIHNAGTLGGLTTEFLSNYNATSGGTGQTYLSVTGGSMASAFNTNGFISPFNGNTADIQAQFTTQAFDPVNGNNWLVSSQDPVFGNFAPVPEPSTYGLAAAGALAGIIALRRRIQKRALA